MRSLSLLLALMALLVGQVARAYPYDEQYVDWNINVNEAAGTDVLLYDSERGSGRNQTYHESPTNWRALPFYNIILDKFAVRPHRLRQLPRGGRPFSLAPHLASVD